MTISVVAPATGFAPLVRDDARILILGSLPSARSIRSGEYYAHPRNAFWRIMATLFAARGNYEQRCATLLGHKIAVWDVLASATRPGSLDAAIDMQSAEVNDFETFFQQHSQIEKICFNGQKSAQIFAQRVVPALPLLEVERQTLPSTSPAHAALSVAEKTERWRAALADSE